MNKKINYLKIYIIISAILYFVYITTFTLLYYRSGDMSGIGFYFYFCLIPFISSFVIFFIGTKTQEKDHLRTKIFANIINLSILIIHFWYIFMVYNILWMFSSIDNKEYTEIKDYQIALNSYKAEYVSYFPKTIPKTAKNIKFLRTPVSFTGDSVFYLKFDIDKNYIKSETEAYQAQSEIIKTNLINKFINNVKYNYNKINVISELHYILGYNTEIKNWTIYKIKRNECFSGIATKDNTIIYILSCD